MSTVFPSSMPYDNVGIIDQTGYIEETVVEAPFIPEGPVAFVPFISPRGYGEDNKLQYMSASRLAKYGNPNLKKYGLSLYLAKQVMAAGGTVLGMRVTTDKYAHANICVYANVKKTKIVKYETVVNNAESINCPVFDLYEDQTLISNKYFNEITITDPTDVSTMTINGSMIENDTRGTVKIGEDTVDIQFIVTKDTKTNTITGISFDVLEEEMGTDGKTPTGNYVPNGSRYKLEIYDTINIKYTKDSFEGKKSLKEIRSSLIENYKKIDSVSTWDGTEKIIPLFYIASKGAGSYGNGFKIRITVDEAMKAYNDMVGGKGFVYKFIDSDNNVKLDNPISFTFNDDYIYKDESMSVEEVFAKYTENVIMEKASSFDDLLTIINYYCCDSSNSKNLGKDIEEIDILFGSNVDDKTILNIDRTELMLDNAIGIPLTNGAEETANFDFHNDIYATALVDAYKGDVTDLIFDHVRYPFQFVFCPSANENVVNAVHELVTQNRKITSAYYFVLGSNGTIVPETYEDAILNKPKGVNSYKEMIVPEWARITDTYTGKKTFMPSVYFNAYSIINHWINRKGKPLAGRLNATWSGFDIGTVKPASSNVDKYIANHNAYLNTMIEDGIGNAELYEQITAQTTTSSLSEVNNMQVLHEMVKIALKLAKENRWSDLGEEDINSYKMYTESTISDKLKGCYEHMEVIATRESSNGAGRNRMLCKINVKFKDMFKGVSYEFYILAQ